MARFALLLITTACVPTRKESASPAGDDSGGVDSGSPALCAEVGQADRTLDLEAGDVLAADGVPVWVSKGPGWAELPVEVDGLASVAVFYDGGNSVTAVLQSESSEEIAGCTEDWPACEALTARAFAVVAGVDYRLELGSDVERVWLVAMDGALAPGPCGG